MATKARRGEPAPRRAGPPAAGDGPRRQDLATRLNEMVAALVAENRKLQREIARLAERASARAAAGKRKSKPVSRPKMRVAKSAVKRKPARAAAPKRKTKPAPTRRKRA